MITAIASITSIAGKKNVQQSLDRMETSFSDRSDHSISQRPLKSGFHLIATIAERFLQRSYENQHLDKIP